MKLQVIYDILIQQTVEIIMKQLRYTCNYCLWTSLLSIIVVLMLLLKNI